MADSDIGVVVSLPADAEACRRVVAVLRVVKRLLHEPGKRNRTVALEVVPDEGDERQRSWHRNSGMFDNGKFEWIVNRNPLEHVYKISI
jgi:hypothetical protein